jgi:ubiquinone biosynthesis protein COQ9
VTQRLALARHKESLDAEESEGKKLGVGAKVKKLTSERLMANKEVVHRWQEVRIISSS